MTTPSLSDLRYLYYGGGSAAEYQALLDAQAAGVTAVDIINLLGGGSYAAATDDIVSSKVVGDTNSRFVINANGKIEWGPGNAALDTYFQRSAAATLETNATLILSTGNATGQVFAGGVGPGGEGGIVLGSALDTNLYRSAANMLKTDDDLIIGGDLTLSASDLITDDVTGTKIGTATTQKLGFFGVAPVNQRTNVANPSAPGAIYSQAEAQSTRNAVVSILDRLEQLGLFAA